MHPEQFVAKWSGVEFGEKQASQEMFLDICAVVGHPTPVGYGDPQAYTFEKWVPGGFADAYLEGCFGWEFKGSDEQLEALLRKSRLMQKSDSCSKKYGHWDASTKFVTLKTTIRIGDSG